MFAEIKEKTPTEQSRLREEAISGLKFALGCVVAGTVAYTLLTAAPNLIDRNCSKSGYAPVTLSRCLPEEQVKSTDWEITYPNPFGESVVMRGKPIAHELPLFVFLAFLSVAAVSGCFSLGRLTFLKLGHFGDSEHA